jgi:cytochrome c oxidase assembly factor CtaG
VIYKRKQSFWPFGAKICFFGGMITKIGTTKDPKSIQNRSGQKYFN